MWYKLNKFVMELKTRRIEELMDAEPGTMDYLELERLSKEVNEHETSSKGNS